MLLAIHAPALGATITLNDAMMANADWGATKFGPGTTSHTSVQSTAGGGGAEGPVDPYRRVTHTITDGHTTLRVFHGYLPSVYDPSVSGGISDLDFSIDYRTFNFAVNVEFGLMQSGTLYRAPGFTMTTADTTWDTFSLGSQTAADFFSIIDSSQPDFSSAGLPILFGFITRNSTVNAGVVTTSGYDNFQLDIHQIPEPASLGLVATGVLVLCWHRQRHRVAQQAGLTGAKLS